MYKKIVFCKKKSQNDENSIKIQIILSSMAKFFFQNSCCALENCLLEKNRNRIKFIAKL